RENPSDVLALTGASAALSLSDMHWGGPIAGVRVGRVDGQLVVNPTFAEQERSDLNLVVACSRDAIVMVEGGAKEIPEAAMIDALLFAHRECQPIIDLQEKIRAAAGKPRRDFTPPKKDEELETRVRALSYDRVKAAMALAVKHDRYGALGQTHDD